jgi:glucan phosphoethanolaminetransferase (alkaline phosphatase superfamily)
MKYKLTTPKAVLFIILGVAALTILSLEYFPSNFQNILTEFPAILLSIVLLLFGISFFYTKLKK